MTVDEWDLMRLPVVISRTEHHLRSLKAELLVCSPARAVKLRKFIHNNEIALQSYHARLAELQSPVQLSFF